MWLNPNETVDLVTFTKEILKNLKIVQCAPYSLQLLQKYWEQFKTAYCSSTIFLITLSICIRIFSYQYCIFSNKRPRRLLNFGTVT